MPANVYYRNPDGTITTPLYWKCTCPKNSIHSHLITVCNRCGTRSENAPFCEVQEVVKVFGKRIPESIYKIFQIVLSGEKDK